MASISSGWWSSREMMRVFTSWGLLVLGYSMCITDLICVQCSRCSYKDISRIAKNGIVRSWKEKLNRQIQNKLKSTNSSKILLVLIRPHISTNLRMFIPAHVLNNDLSLILICFQEIDGFVEITTKIFSKVIHKTSYSFPWHRWI